MEYALTVCLTLVISWAIIIFVRHKQKKYLNRVLRRQSDMHNLIKLFASRDIQKTSKLKSQMSKRIEDNSISMVIVDDKAYWVTNNIFYVADAEDNHPVLETAIPIDTSDMSKDDVDKMLFILDNLIRGKNNDSGSTGHKRF